jgi:hypothetical protein
MQTKTGNIQTRTGDFKVRADLRLRVQPGQEGVRRGSGGDQEGVRWGNIPSVKGADWSGGGNIPSAEGRDWSGSGIFRQSREPIGQKGVRFFFFFFFLAAFNN